MKPSRPRGRNPRSSMFWAAARMLWDEGQNSREIGRRLGIRYSAVDAHAKKHGWPEHPPYAALFRERNDLSKRLAHYIGKWMSCTCEQEQNEAR